MIKNILKLPLLVVSVKGKAFYKLERVEFKFCELVLAAYPKERVKVFFYSFLLQFVSGWLNGAIVLMTQMWS